MILVLWIVSVIVFLMMSFTGDPVFMVVPIDATDAEIAQARRLLGLDQSLLVQYWKFISSLVQGDFGQSYVFRQPAMTLILERLPATVEMVLVAMVLAVIVAIPLGVYAGANPNGRLSRTIMAGSLLGISLPGFWVGMVLIYLFAVNWGLFPSSGRGDTEEIFGLRLSLLTVDGWHHIMLPAVIPIPAASSTAFPIRLTGRTASARSRDRCPISGPSQRAAISETAVRAPRRFALKRSRSSAISTTVSGRPVTSPSQREKANDQITDAGSRGQGPQDAFSRRRRHP